MTRLGILALAASTLLPAAAAAQTVAPPVRWQDTPDARLDVRGAPPPTATPRAAPAPAPQPGVTWRAAPPPAVQPMPPQPPLARSAPPPRPLPVPTVRAEADHHRGAHGGMERGGRVHPMMLADRYRVEDWRRYGFPPPVPGGRWIRHHGDAMLLDRDGRIVDVRADVDWDRDHHAARDHHAGRYADNGPGHHYRGDFDDEPYDDEFDGDDDHYDDEPAFLDHGPYGPPPIHGGWTYMPVTVTETTTTTVTESGGTICCETRTHHPRPRKVIRSKIVHPPYRGGEKG